ncbi:MAG TPA: hypothetical protein VFU15_07060, partial [Bacteroidia bacterium]|nr:hypothetical protein [Bacteroidia bacterium]
GEKVVAGLEKTFTLVKTLVTEGPMAAWEQLKEIAGDMRDAFIDAVKDFIATKIIEQAITWLVSIFVPGAGIIKAIIGIYDTIVFFIQKAKEIMQMIGNFLGSIAEIAAGNIGAAADALENGLARGLSLVINFLAKLLHLDGITSKIRNAISKIRAKVDAVIEKVAKWVAEKAKKIWGKITGKEEPKKEGADSAAGDATPISFEVKEPFSMDGKSHHLILQVKANTPSLLIASDPALLIPALENAMTEVRSSSRTATEKADILDWLERAHKEAKDVPFTVKARINDVLKGKPHEHKAEQEAIAREEAKELAQIANVLFTLSRKWNVKALDDFFKAPPTRRYIPGSSQTEIGKFIRGRLYENMHDWSSASKSFKTAEFPGLKTKVLAIQSDAVAAKNKGNKAGLQIAKDKWQDAIDNGLILKNADIFTHTPDVSDYHADHDPPLTDRWNAGGNDGDDNLREKQVKGNLVLMTSEKNLSLGSRGGNYDPFVLPRFTSSIADGGIVYARSIDGKRFVDAAKKPIT